MSHGVPEDTSGKCGSTGNTWEYDIYPIQTYWFQHPYLTSLAPWWSHVFRPIAISTNGGTPLFSPMPVRNRIFSNLIIYAKWIYQKFPEKPLQNNHGRCSVYGRCSIVATILGLPQNTRHIRNCRRKEKGLAEGDDSAFVLQNGEDVRPKSIPQLILFRLSRNQLV